MPSARPAPKTSTCSPTPGSAAFNVATLPSCWGRDEPVRGRRDTARLRRTAPFCWGRLGDAAGAARSDRHALELTANAAERAFLEQRLAEVGRAAGAEPLPG
ncbi:hypothetical protein QDR37_16275 [Amnibacterium sp. CER49]|uniref:hypothetical protein n=1 Tax=Amnibacterium sp. CER49 TaxID=3039161 RepID=UPI0024484830|nr:hypothetical protein [Amnibacterium sp. CER49]MDH2445504.1 hypothetical protein [Amnibacterium sp. CER49]